MPNVKQMMKKDDFLNKFYDLVCKLIKESDIEELENFKADYFLDVSDEEYREALVEGFSQLKLLDWKQELVIREFSKRFPLEYSFKMFNDFDKFLDKKIQKMKRSDAKKRKLLEQITPEATQEVAKADGDWTDEMNKIAEQGAKDLNEQEKQEE